MHTTMALLIGFIGLAQVSADTLPPAEERPDIDTEIQADNGELSAYLLQAQERNPALQSLHARWLAALQRVPQARSLEDPMFTFNYFIESPEKEFWVALGQKFPWFGTLRLRAEQAAHEAEAARERLMVERNRIILETKRAYYDLAAQHDTVGILEAENALQVELENLVRDRYALGLEMQDDVLRLELERERHHDLILSLQAQRPALAAALNEVIGRGIQDDVSPPETMPLPGPPPAAEDVALLIAQMHPELRELEAMAEAASTGVQLARKTGYPELVLETMFEQGRDPGRASVDPSSPGRIAAYRGLTGTALGQTPFDLAETANTVYDLAYRDSMSTEYEWSISVGFSLPIYRKRVRAAVEEARLNLQALELDQQAALRRLESEAHLALFRMQDAERQYRLVLERLQPTAAQNTAIVRERYATGDESTMLADVLMAIREEYALQRMGVDLLRDWRYAAAELRFLLGGDHP